MDVEKTIERFTDEFTEATMKKFEDLSQFSTESLEWLMMEHFQSSFRNCEFLSDAARCVGDFDTDAVKKELMRNISEELDHAKIYKSGLKKVGCDVDTRKKFAVTDDFLDEIGKLCNRDPSSVLGTIYVTETTAIFELELLRAVAKEVIARRNLGSKGNELIGFHDMHLTGVEQSHRDELGIFLRGVQPDKETSPRDGERPTIKPKNALEGGRAVIGHMVQWWEHLLASMIAQSKNTAITV